MTRRGKPARGWRKVAASIWGHPNDPQIYADLELDATSLLAFVPSGSWPTVAAPCACWRGTG
jgi:hypothetical protein